MSGGLPDALRCQLDRTPTSALLEYLAERLGGPDVVERLVGQARSAGESLPSDTRSLAELLGERLDLAVGQCRLELTLEDGRLVNLWRHERIGATALGRFDRLAEDGRA